MAEIVEDWEKYVGGRALLSELDELLAPDENGVSTLVEGVNVPDVQRALAHALALIEERNS